MKTLAAAVKVSQRARKDSTPRDKIFVSQEGVRHGTAAATKVFFGNELRAKSRVCICVRRGVGNAGVNRPWGVCFGDMSSTCCVSKGGGLDSRPGT
jgi:hypothetical protein